MVFCLGKRSFRHNAIQVQECSRNFHGGFKDVPPVAGVPESRRSYMVCLGIRAEEGEPGMMLGRWKV